MDIIKQITDHGYEIKPTDEQYGDVYKVINGRELRFLRIYNDGKEIGRVTMATTPVHFRFGLDTTLRDIFEAYYELDENEISLLENGYSLHTKNYLSSIQSNIGLIDMYESDTLPKELKGLQPEYAIEIYVNAPTEIYKAEDCWFAITVVRYEADDSFAVVMRFDREPTTPDLATAFDIRDVKRYFSTGTTSLRSEEFVCSNCNHKQHWLDTPGSLSDKLNNIKGQHCGSC